MKKAAICGVLALMAVAGLAAGLFWLKPHSAARQVLMLPNGQICRIAGETYGTNHVHGPLAARVVHGLPRAVTNYVAKVAGNRLGKVQSFQFSKPTLCIWLEPAGRGSFHPGGDTFAMLADETGEVAGASCRVGAMLLDFKVAPRRSRSLQLCLFDATNSPPAELGRFQIPNPSYGRFPQWRPEPIPAVKMAGDLAVRLEDLTVLENPEGASPKSAGGVPAASYGPVKGGNGPVTKFRLVLDSSPPDPARRWVIHEADLSDATGNHLSLAEHTPSIRTSTTTEQGWFKGTLWPSEGAWRLKLQLKRGLPPNFLLPLKFEPSAFGFRPAEVITFKNVPLGSLTTTIQTTNTEDLAKVELRVGTPTVGNPSFEISWPANPEGVAVDLVSVASSTGERLNPLQLTTRAGWGAAGCITFMIVRTDAAAADITLAVQKTRSIEFFVRPPAP